MVWSLRIDFHIRNTGKPDTMLMPVHCRCVGMCLGHLTRGGEGLMPREVGAQQLLRGPVPGLGSLLFDYKAKPSEPEVPSSPASRYYA